MTAPDFNGNWINPATTVIIPAIRNTLDKKRGMFAPEVVKKMAGTQAAAFARFDLQGDDLPPRTTTKSTSYSINLYTCIIGEPTTSRKIPGSTTDTSRSGS